MKISYEFVTGEISEVEVDEHLGGMLLFYSTVGGWSQQTPFQSGKSPAYHCGSWRSGTLQRKRRSSQTRS